MITMRLIYLGYYFKNMDFAKLSLFTEYVHQSRQISKARLWTQMLYDSLKYNISPLEYFQFGFYKKQDHEKLEWAGTGTMYEYQRIMNPIEARGILDDKREFGKKYSDFILHQTKSLTELEANASEAEKILSNRSEKIVLKVANGKCGKNVEILQAAQFSADSLIGYMKEKGYDMVEEYVVQHDEMNRLSPSGVNTVRIITQLDAQGNAEIVACRQRISVNSKVDNMAAGNIAATIDDATGVITGKGFYSDITKDPVDNHPITGVQLIGFQIPFWQEIIQMVKNAAELHPCNRSIGWDVILTNRGPGLLEGNHDWCKLVYQLPAQKGFKPVLDRYLNEYLQTRDGVTRS